MKSSIPLILLLAVAIQGSAQEGEVITVSSAVGPEFDSAEKAKYHLFPYFPSKNFESAQFVKMPDGKIIIKAKMKDGSIQERASSQSEVDWIRDHIDGKIKAEVSKEIETATGNDDSLAIYLITMNDASTFHGKIVMRGKSTITVESQTLGKVTIKLSDIKEIQKVDKTSIKNDGIWFPNPNSTRYFFGPTAIPLKKGEGYYQNVYVFINSFQVGISDNISIGAGIEPISFILSVSNGSAPPFYLTGKVGFQVAEKVHIGGGVLLLSFFDTYSGILFGVGTFGSEEKNVTLGTGYGFVNGELAESPIFTFSGMTRVGRKLALVTENWMLPSSLCDYDNVTGQRINCKTEYSPYFSYGFRIMEQKTTWDLGFLNSPAIFSFIPIGIPYVDFVLKF